MRLIPYQSQQDYLHGRLTKEILIVMAIALSAAMIAIIIKKISNRYIDGLMMFLALDAIILIIPVAELGAIWAFGATSGQQSAITANIRKAESYYGISDISIAPSKERVMLTSAERSDGDSKHSLKDRDAEKDMTSGITFSKDGRRYSGTIKKSHGMISISKNNGEHLQKQR